MVKWTAEQKKKISERLKKAYKEGRRVSSSTRPEVRVKISEGVKKAYREGRAISPSTRPEVAAKISEGKRKSSYVHSEETKEKIRQTLKRKYKSGELISSLNDPVMNKKIRACRKGEYSRTIEQRKKISESVKKDWEEGIHDNHGKAMKSLWKNKKLKYKFMGPSKTESLIIKEMKEIGFEFNKRININQKDTNDVLWYRPDFLHKDKKIIIEIDGSSHGPFHRIEYDKVKDATLSRLGYRVYRFKNQEVISNPDHIITSTINILIES